MAIEYRCANVQDLPQMERLLESVMGDMRDLRHDQFTVAIRHGTVVGCVRIKELEGGCQELASLVVEAELRGKGIGSRLVSVAASRERARPIYLLCLEETGPFYTRLGFVKASVEDLPDPLKQEYLRISGKLASLKRSIVAMMSG